MLSHIFPTSWRWLSVPHLEAYSTDQFQHPPRLTHMRQCIQNTIFEPSISLIVGLVDYESDIITIFHIDIQNKSFRRNRYIRDIIPRK